MFKLPKVVECSYSMIEISKGRREIEKAIEANYRIPFTLHGFINPHRSNVGNSDDVGTEFGATTVGFSIGTPEYVPVDKMGRAYALFRDVLEGDRLQCDGDFTCMKDRSTKTVKRDPLDGRLYISCSGKSRKHFLDGQEGKHGELVGLYKVLR